MQYWSQESQRFYQINHNDYDEVKINKENSIKIMRYEKKRKEIQSLLSWPQCSTNY